MKTKLALTLLVMAAVSINLHAATSALPAPLPDFMDQAQLTKWNADQAAAAKTTVSASEPSTQFYTGKPYVADAGGYIYKYRTYNPEMSRWTSADPSGFPDGVNNRRYVAVPTFQFDSDGLITESDTTGGYVDVPGSGTGSFPGFFNSASYFGESSATASSTTGEVTFDSEIGGHTAFDSDTVTLTPNITISIIPGTSNLTYTVNGTFGGNGTEGIVGSIINFTVTGDGTSTLIVHATVSYSLSADWISGGVSIGGDGPGGTATMTSTGLSQGPIGFGDYTFTE